MVLVTLAAPLGGLVVGAGGALVGALLDGALTRSGVMASLVGAAGYTVGAGWAAALLGWMLQGEGTFGGAVLGAVVGAGVAIGATLAVIPVFGARTIPPALAAALTPALVASALVLPALGASVAFEASHDLSRSRARLVADLQPAVLLDGSRPAIGVALGGSF
jgi:hypothetical protein